MHWWNLLQNVRHALKRTVSAEVGTRSHITLYNTLAGAVEVLRPIRDGVVKMYHCGPTVYGEQHIGNLSMYVFTDTLRRALEATGLRVEQVINITDVGHLVSDGDDGEDKMTKGLKREGMQLTLENMRSLAEKYASLFLRDLERLNIRTEGTRFPRASDHIPAQIAMIRTLEEKGYAYRGTHGVYFDTTRFPAYGKLGNINLTGLQEGARVTVADDKRHPTDFLLWKFDGALGWESPWGLGFPGWHIECSAMIRELLGEQIDIHTGGIEHIPVHHNNEIAQTESATGKVPFARVWMHRAHLQIENAKIAKSVGNAIYLDDIVQRGFHPLSFRYLLLGAHYRQSVSFTWESLAAAQTAFLKLRKMIDELPEGGRAPSPYREKMAERIKDDLDTAGVLAQLWDMVNDQHLESAHLRAGILFADRLLGLNFDGPDELALTMYRKEFGSFVPLHKVPEHIQTLLAEREAARAARRFDRADTIRDRIAGEGYVVEDTPDGPRVLAKF